MQHASEMTKITQPPKSTHRPRHDHNRHRGGCNTPARWQKLRTPAIKVLTMGGRRCHTGSHSRRYTPLPLESSTAIAGAPCAPRGRSTKSYSVNTKVLLVHYRTPMYSTVFDYKTCDFRPNRWSTLMVKHFSRGEATKINAPATPRSQSAFYFASHLQCYFQAVLAQAGSLLICGPAAVHPQFTTCLWYTLCSHGWHGRPSTSQAVVCQGSLDNRCSLLLPLGAHSGLFGRGGQQGVQASSSESPP